MKGRKKRKWIKALILLVILTGLFFAGYWVYSQEITQFEVIGTNDLDQVMVIETIFPDEMSKKTVRAFWDIHYGEHVKVPGVERYDIRLKGWHKVELVVYERQVIAGIPYLGHFLYFDREGYIMKTSFSALAGLPLVAGVNYDYFSLGSRLPVENNRVFELALIAAQQLSIMNLSADYIYFDKNLNMTIMMDKLDVYLGTGTHLEEKFGLLSDIIGTLPDVPGVLYLDSYDSGNPKGSYFFKRKDEEA